MEQEIMFVSVKLVIQHQMEQEIMSVSVKLVIQHQMEQEIMFVKLFNVKLKFDATLPSQNPEQNACQNIK